MGKHGIWHCDKRQGKTRAPISMNQLAREGRLKPADDSGVKRIVLRTRKNKTTIKTVGWHKYTF